jgi:single-stranded DNA-binding protein
MNNTQNENNIANISGKIVLEPKFSHEIYGEGFYNFSIEIPRLSKSEDKIIVTVSERLIPIKDLVIGKFVYVDGQFRSYNNYSGEGSKLLLTVFAREINFIEGDDQNKNQNQIFLNGYICKKPVYRTTPFGREIADILVAVNRHYNKSDYIPCITWGRNARFSSNLNVGDNIKIWGRIQSREYQKKVEEGELLTKIAYEVSIAKLEAAEGEEANKEMEEVSEGEDKIESEE